MFEEGDKINDQLLGCLGQRGNILIELIEVKHNSFLDC